MPRATRFYVPGVPCHVIQRGNNRAPCFFADRDRRLYLDWLQEAGAKFGCSVHAYVLMTNHVHLLMTPKWFASISLAMQSLGRRYVRYVNQVYGRSGTLWEGRYKASVIDSEAYFFACARYIELNPVRAGLAPGPGDYRWSSYARTGTGASDPLVAEHPLYQGLGNSDAARQLAYRELFRESLDPAQLEAIRSAVQLSRPLGDERFKAALERQLRRSISYRHPGRPFKPNLRIN